MAAPVSLLVHAMVHINESLRCLAVEYKAQGIYWLRIVRTNDS